MVTVLLQLVLLLVVLGLIWWLIGFLPLPSPIKQIINVVFIIVAILSVLGILGLIDVDLPRIRL